MKKNLNFYLAGLVEGEGNFVVPKQIYDAKERFSSAKVKVAFPLRDKPLAELLQSKFGGNFEVHRNHIVWIVSDTENLILLCNTINGCLRTPKLYNFYRLIDYLNQKCSESLIDKAPLDSSSIDSNAWLAGFSDANGNFSISITQRKNNRKRVQLQYCLEVQPWYDNVCLSKHIPDLTVSLSFCNICEKIATLLKCGFYYRSKKFSEMITVAAHTSNSHANVIKYLDKFPLFSSKRLDYDSWKSIYTLQTQQLHLTSSGIQICESIQQKFNSKRQTFSWFHLKNFY